MYCGIRGQKSLRFLKDNFPFLKMQNLNELVDSENFLDLRAANNTPVPFGRFVELTFELSKLPGGDILMVPFHVSNKPYYWL